MIFVDLLGFLKTTIGNGTMIIPNKGSSNGHSVALFFGPYSTVLKGCQISL